MSEGLFDDVPLCNKERDKAWEAFIKRKDAQNLFSEKGFEFPVNPGYYDLWCICWAKAWDKGFHAGIKIDALEAADALEALAQPDQEPVAYLSNKRQRLNIEIKPQTFVEIPTATDWEMPLYMKPPQRTWVELTDEEIEELANEYLFAEEDLEMLFVGGSVEFARALLKKAKEK